MYSVLIAFCIYLFDKYTKYKVTQVYIARDYSSINQLPLNINRLYELFWSPLERNIEKVKCA